MKLIKISLLLQASTLFGVAYSQFGYPAQPINVVYQGEGCQCQKRLPYHVEKPKITETRDTHYGFGYKVEMPDQEPAEIKYSFDFRVERPQTGPQSYP